MSDRSHDGRDEFYVGYLPTPPRCLQIVRVLVLVLAVWIVGMGIVMAAFMRAPGDAVWDTAEERTWHGTLVMEPYPLLVPLDGSPALMVMEMGKVGAHDRVASLDRKDVELRGFLLERDGRRIIELSPGEASIAWKSDFASRLPGHWETSDETVTLLGEIVDGKCYMGAMKPGDGLTHKACATLCIRGGQPPMFVTPTPDGPEFRLLIVDGIADLPEDLLALVAEPVRIEGEMVDVAGIPAILVSADAISLLP